jgi:hypothetical protein
MTLKSDLIANATAAKNAAQANYEQSVRDLIAAEDSPPDWVCSVNHDASNQTTNIAGQGGTGADLAGALSGVYPGVEQYTPIGQNAAVLKSHTQPASFMVESQTLDSGTSEWINNGASEVVWSQLS